MTRRVDPPSILRRCGWCGKISGGFYCATHARRRNARERANRKLVRQRAASFIARNGGGSNG